VAKEVYERKAIVLSVNHLFEDRPKLLNRLCLNPIEGNAWHADHIVGVAQGGGECDEDNIRTLCVLCHAAVTAEQAKERARENRRKKKRKLEGPAEAEVEVGIPAGAMLSIGEDGSVTGLIYHQHGGGNATTEQEGHETGIV
jgi:5-methylcytosine-specific restriction endonuclease McrA